MPDNLEEQLAAAAARLEQETPVRPPAGVRARGNQRRRRHTATMAAAPIAVLAIAGTLGLALRPPGGPSRQDLTGPPTASSIQTPTAAPTPAPAATAAPAVTVDLAHHTMAVFDTHGTLIKTLKITAGGAAHPTRPGTFTVLNKNPSKTISSPTAGSTNATDYYNLPVAFFIDLGPNAPAIYAVPWQESSLGTANLTHGDIGLDTDDATWLYNQLTVGDTIQIQDTTS